MKLKKLFAALLCTSLLITGCSSDDSLIKGTDNVESGEPSYAAFSIRMGSGITRTDNDENADAEEETISSVKLFIFSNGVLEVAAEPELDENVTIPVAVRTGQKVVYAVTNNHISLTATEGTTLLSDFEKSLFSALDSDIAINGEFPMIGRANATVLKCTQQEAKESPLSMEVDRATAKLQVKFDSETLKVYPTINADFSDCEYAPAQAAKQMYLTLLDGLYTPLGTSDDEIVGTYPGLVSVPATFEDDDDYFSAAVSSFSPAYSANRYMGENVAAEPTTGKVTFALIRLKATPKGKLYGDKDLPADGTFYVAARNVGGKSTWVYASDENYNIVYFADEEDAAAFIEEKNLSDDYAPYKFDKGQCYYRVNILNTSDTSLSLSERYRVVRNNYYRVNVTEIKNLGAPTAPGVVPDDPDTPLEQDSFISCEINIVPWTLHDQNGVLQ